MKKKIIACVLACATLLMGTGFAYWTDLININATAETGYLDVNFTKAESIGNNFEAVEGGLEEQSAYDTTSSNAAFVGSNPDEVSFGITDLYPGHYEVFTASVDNVGTVAAKLGKVSTSITGSNSMTKDMIGISIAADASYITEYDTETTYKDVFVNCIKIFGCDHKHVWVGLCRGYYTKIVDVVGEHIVENHNDDVEINLPEGSTFVIGDVTFVRLSALKDVAVAEQVSNLLYLTNNSAMEFIVTIGMDSDAVGNYTTGSTSVNRPNHDSNTQNTTASVNLGLVWDQYNER